MAFTTFTQSKSTHRAGSLNPKNKFVRGELPLPVFTVNSDNGSLFFTDNGAGGRFTYLSTVSVAYEPANRTQVVVITANDGHTASLSLTVTGTFPLYPQKGYEIEEDQDTKIKTARDGTQYFNEQYKESITWKIGVDRRLKEELVDVWDFLVFHRKVKQFWIYDEERGLMNKVRRVSSLPTKFEGANSWDASCIMKGDYLPTLIGVSGLTTVRLNCGGYTDGNYAADAFFDPATLTWSFGDAVLTDSGVTNSPGLLVMKYARYDPSNVIYTVTGLVANRTYTVELFFVSSGSARTLQVYLQGISISSVAVLSTGQVVRFATTYAADSSGQMIIRIARVTGANALIGAISLT